METSLCTNVHELEAYLHKITFVPENSDISYTITAIGMLSLTSNPWRKLHFYSNQHADRNIHSLKVTVCI
jgi:hypothetical protein